MGQVIPFANDPHTAWLAYFRLEQQATPELMRDINYLDRRLAAKERYFELEEKSR